MANNTYLERDGEDYIIRLHSTGIVTFKPDGSIVLDSGGWQTVTTKDRMNRYLPSTWRVGANRGTWFVWWRCGKVWADHPFADGMTLQPDGTVEGAGKEPDWRLADRITRFAREYGTRLVTGKIGKPDAGDCLYCQMLSGQQSGITYGTLDATGKFKRGGLERQVGHLASHMAERYFVPSLLVAAARCVRTAPAFYGELCYVWGEGEGKCDNAFTRDYLRSEAARVLASYLRAAFGLAQRRTCDLSAPYPFPPEKETRR